MVTIGPALYGRLGVDQSNPCPPPNGQDTRMFKRLFASRNRPCFIDYYVYIFCYLFPIDKKELSMNHPDYCNGLMLLLNTFNAVGYF